MNPNPPNAEPVVVMIPGDLHLTEPGLENERVAAWAIKEANDLIRPDFVQFIGDNVQDGTVEQFRLFRSLADCLTCPWHALVGDHDAQGDAATTCFRQLVGEPYRSDSVRGYRFVRLNTQEARPVGLSTTQVDWFRDQADAARESGERLIVFQHNYPYQIWETFDGPGIDAWREIMQTRRIDVLFSGHTHYLQTANDGRNVMVATRSIGDPEGGRPGYLLAYLCGDDLAFRYRTIDDVGPLVLITHPRDRRTATGPAQVVAGPDRVRARIWSRDSRIQAEWRLDDGPWQSMSFERDHDSTGDLPEGLAKGDHRLEIRGLAEDGQSGHDTIVFAVDPTRRFTAVPGAWPAVASTNFC